jgi:hypothetical protein
MCNPCESSSTPRDPTTIHHLGKFQPHRLLVDTRQTVAKTAQAYVGKSTKHCHITWVALSSTGNTPRPTHPKSVAGIRHFSVKEPQKRTWSLEVDGETITFVIPIVGHCSGYSQKHTRKYTYILEQGEKLQIFRAVICSLPAGYHTATLREHLE